jgi:uncharacterized iron-regulated membrane protein
LKRFRTILFWCHLTAGVFAGLVIFVMCITGALLAFEPQILRVIERNVRDVQAPKADAQRVGVGTLLAVAVAHKPGAPPTGVTLESTPTAAAAVAFGREGTVYVNPYTSEILGESSSWARAVFQTLTSWHRWLGSEGAFRSTARALTGASNLAFLGLAISGLYLWLPRKWNRKHVKAVAVFDGRARGKARDFNWHNVIGFWCSPVLIVLTATAVVMSYPWANDLLYRLTGSTPPSAAGPGGEAGTRPGGGRGRDGRPAQENERRRETGERGQPVPLPDNLGFLIARAEQSLPTWGSMTVRLASRPGGPVSFTLTDAAHWNAFARSQLTLDGTSGDVIRWEPYANASLGQKARGWVRFGHTGELGGWPGQLVAGLACVAGTVLVWTGLALALRRFFGWRRLKRFLTRGRTIEDNGELTEDVA